MRSKVKATMRVLQVLDAVAVVELTTIDGSGEWKRVMHLLAGDSVHVTVNEIEESDRASAEDETAALIEKVRKV